MPKPPRQDDRTRTSESGAASARTEWFEAQCQGVRRNDQTNTTDNDSAHAVECWNCGTRGHCSVVSKELQQRLNALDGGNASVLEGIHENYCVLHARCILDERENEQGSHQQTVQKKDEQGSSHLSRGRCKQAKLKFQYYQSCWSRHA